MNLRGVASTLSVCILLHLNIGLATDWMHGERDPFGPYPRIPDKEKLKVTFTIVMNLIR